jgi:ferric-dicitrate binding protein FerR (iron transport regulator)
MEVVCQKLGRWFNAEIIIKDESLKAYSFTGTFQEEGLSEILDLISLTSPVRFKLYERSINKQNEYGPSKVEIMKR